MPSDLIFAVFTALGVSATLMTGWIFIMWLKSKVDKNVTKR